MLTQPEKTERNEEIIFMHKEGMNNRQIGEKLNISTPRVSQIISRWKWREIYLK